MHNPFRQIILIAFSMMAFTGLYAKSSDTTSTVAKDSFKLQLLVYDTSGTITLGNNIAQLQIPRGFKYLDGKQSEYVLHNLWGNPPSTSLGMLFPDSANNIIPNTWAIEITYSEEGHIKDDDAKDIKYGELLQKMQDAIEEENPERKKEGYRTFKLTGWASEPYYDEKEKKLHWAKKLLFEGDSSETLNYNIRILGRKGVLVLNAIGDVSQLDEIKSNINPILGSVNFSDGNKYSDFNASIDKVAAYGIGGLIAGGVLLKTGLLSKLGLILLKFIKPILLGIAAVSSAVWRFFTGKNKSDS